MSVKAWPKTWHLHIYELGPDSNINVHIVTTQTAKNFQSDAILGFELMCYIKFLSDNEQ